MVIFFFVSLGAYMALFLSMNPRDALFVHIGFTFMAGLHLISRSIEKDKTFKKYGLNEKGDATLDELNQLEAKYNKEKSK